MTFDSYTIQIAGTTVTVESCKTLASSTDYANSIRPYRVTVFLVTSNKYRHRYQTKVYELFNKGQVKETIREWLDNVLVNHILVEDDCGSWQRYTPDVMAIGKMRASILEELDKAYEEEERAKGNKDIGDAASIVKSLESAKCFDARRMAIWNHSKMRRVKHLLANDPHGSRSEGIQWQDCSGNTWLTRLTAEGEFETKRVKISATVKGVPEV